MCGSKHAAETCCEWCLECAACKNVMRLESDTLALAPQCSDGDEAQGMSAGMAPAVPPAPTAEAQ